MDQSKIAEINFLRLPPSEQPYDLAGLGVWELVIQLNQGSKWPSTSPDKSPPEEGCAGGFLQGCCPGVRD